MHVYVYDSFLNQKKYDRILARLETRITDLGLNGKISILLIMKLNMAQKLSSLLVTIKPLTKF